MNLLCFKVIKVFNSAQNYLRQNSVCAKQFTFRRSAVPCLWKEYQDEIECQETFSNQALANWTYVEKIFRTVKCHMCGKIFYEKVEITENLQKSKFFVCFLIKVSTIQTFYLKSKIEISDGFLVLPILLRILNDLSPWHILVLPDVNLH